MKQPYNTALYMRLSRDDENYGDSVSIETSEPFYSSTQRIRGFMWSASTSTTDGVGPPLKDRISSE